MPKKNTTKPAPTTEPAATVEPTVNTPALPPAAQIALALLHAETPTTAADLSDRCGLARSTVTKALGILLEKGLATRQDGGHDGGRRIADRWIAAPVAAAPPVAADDAAEAQPGAGAPDDSGNTSAVKKADSNSMPDLKASGGEEGVDSDETDADADAEDAASIQPEPDDEAVGDAHGETLAEGGVDTVEADAAGGAKPAPGGGAAASRLGKGALRAMVQAHLRENPGRAWTPTAISKVLGRSAGAINNACVKLTEDGAVTTFEDKPIRFQWNSDASADAS